MLGNDKIKLGFRKLLDLGEVEANTRNTELILPLTFRDHSFPPIDTLIQLYSFPANVRAAGQMGQRKKQIVAAI